MALKLIHKQTHRDVLVDSIQELEPSIKNDEKKSFKQQRSHDFDVHA